MLDRQKMISRSSPLNESPGRVFWITGLSGSGKTTVGQELTSRLRASGFHAVFLDGDELRAAFSADLGYSDDQRRLSAMRNARVCQLLSSQGVQVVCATISLFHEVHQWNRENIKNYHEIFLKVPLVELELRDPKGIYAQSKVQGKDQIVGIHLVPEFPENPDLTIDNHTGISVSRAVDMIWGKLIDNAWTPRTDSAAVVTFGTKAETLEKLAPYLKKGHILPLYRFSVDDWERDRDRVLSGITSQLWSQSTLIVRSSAITEDRKGQSSAGKFDSVCDVLGGKALSAAITRVVDSFEGNEDPANQVLIQPMLTDLAMAGVAFTQDPNGGGPYVIVNYDDSSGRADTITSGGSQGAKTYYGLRSNTITVPNNLVALRSVLSELEILLDSNSIDVEFAIDRNGTVYVLQVRPLGSDVLLEKDKNEFEAVVKEIANKIELLNRPHPYLYGRRSVFGVMPDWNPAEIIGIKPKPLAFSLYRELITDSIWAYQRDNYGYMNLRSFPLLINFHGLPYVDVRVSFNSFVPNDVSEDLAERLVNYYVERLLADRGLHDKVEFEIIFSCYTLDLPERLEVLRQYGFSAQDLTELSSSLRGLTNRIIHQDTGLWRRDRDKIDILAARLPMIRDAGLDKVSKLYWLIEDCKRYGTLPFAGLARAGFIAVQLLRSLVSTGVIGDAEYASFMSGLDTVGSRIGHDFSTLDKADFLARYGHLRPGTYDICSPRYDEEPDLYFDWNSPPPKEATHAPFSLSLQQFRAVEKLLKMHQIDIPVIDFMEFIKEGIESREYAKFVFSKSLSDALSLLKELGEEHGLTPEACAYLDFSVVRELYSASGNVAGYLQSCADAGRKRYETTRKIILPPVLAGQEEVFGFHVPQSEPNFITHKKITAATASLLDPRDEIRGKILFMPSADPGYDWVFTRGIGGFVTQYGGVNSHMAIRAGELGIPAVIGAGEAFYNAWRAARSISLDCATRQVHIIK